MDTKEETQQNSEEKKICTECYTFKTPLWRSGPHGPKSLCNACGIKYNKKRREEEGLDQVAKIQKRSSEVTEILNILQEMPAAGDEVQVLMSKLEEEERAAILLMNLSYGFVNA